MSRTKTDFIVVHAADTPPHMDIGRAEIDRWHKAQGWSMIGYHFVIRRDGTIEVGRNLTDVGAHAKGYNDRSVGICMVGGKSATTGKAENNFTQQQFAALEKLLGELWAKFPKAVLKGHCDLDSGKACPCFDVKAWAEGKVFWSTERTV